MITCTRRLQFCAGHRVLGHENKCAQPHGHNYVVRITAESAGLDALGRVIDFGVLKDYFGTWIDRQWDHGFIIHKDDIVMFEALQQMGAKVFVMPYNPTAENIARYLCEAAILPKSIPVRVIRVEVEETENCHAAYDVSR